VRTLARLSGDDLLDKIAAAIHVVTELGRANLGQMNLTVDGMSVALEITIHAANFRAQRRIPVNTLPQALLLLAMGTPCFLPRLAIPPAAEVLDRKAVPHTTWTGYETMRLWPYGSDPFLFLPDAFQVWRTLDADSPTHPELQKLLRSPMWRHECSGQLWRVSP
jgi:hypothetical protein